MTHCLSAEEPPFKLVRLLRQSRYQHCRTCLDSWTAEMERWYKVLELWIVLAVPGKLSALITSQSIDFKILLKPQMIWVQKYTSDLLVTSEPSRPLTSAGTGFHFAPRVGGKPSEAVFSSCSNYLEQIPRKLQVCQSPWWCHIYSGAFHVCCYF